MPQELCSFACSATPAFVKSPKIGKLLGSKSDRLSSQKHFLVFLKMSENFWPVKIMQFSLKNLQELLTSRKRFSGLILSPWNYIFKELFTKHEMDNSRGYGRIKPSDRIHYAFCKPPGNDSRHK